jgi:hypothetical protein
MQLDRDVRASCESERLRIYLAGNGKYLVIFKQGSARLDSNVYNSSSGRKENRQNKEDTEPVER